MPSKKVKLKLDKAEMVARKLVMFESSGDKKCLRIATWYIGGLRYSKGTDTRKPRKHVVESVASALRKAGVK